MSPKPAQLNAHIDFAGDAQALADLAIECGASLDIRFDEARTNERLVRFYVTEGVIDRPERVGREAVYGYRHLLQLLTARRMVDVGMSLALVAQHTQAAPTKALEQGLTERQPNPAELLVNRFLAGSAPAQSSSGKRARIHASMSAASLSSGGGMDPFRSSSASVMASVQTPLAAPAAPAVPTPKPAPALVDLLDEMRQLRSEILDRLARLERSHARLVAALKPAVDRESDFLISPNVRRKPAESRAAKPGASEAATANPRKRKV